MFQNEITSEIDLLDENGYLINEGWARHPFWKYNRNKISATWLRIKEWDYYYIISHCKNYGVAFTMANLGYMSLFAITWLNFKEKYFHQVDSIGILPIKKYILPETSLKGVIKYCDKKIDLLCTIQNEKRSIYALGNGQMKSGKKFKLEAEFELFCPREMESMNIATSWQENRKAFYYNRKINCIDANGFIKFGKDTYIFNSKESFAGLDWGRGRWPYKNKWYWASASGMINNIKFGFNIGYGFSDRSVASENTIIYGNRIHKLDQVEFIIDKSDYLRPWKFISNDNRFEMDFEPIIDRNSKIDLFILKSIQHQVFGYFTGFVVLDSGKKLNIEKLLGMAEDVFNRW